MGAYDSMSYRYYQKEANSPAQTESILPTFIQVGEWQFLREIDSQKRYPCSIAAQGFGLYTLDQTSVGGSNNPFSAESSNTTIGIAKINGYFLGHFLTRAYSKGTFAALDRRQTAYDHPYKCNQTDVHNHMEDHFLEAVHLLLTKEETRSIRKSLLVKSSDGKTLVMCPSARAHRDSFGNSC